MFLGLKHGTTSLSPLDALATHKAARALGSSRESQYRAETSDGGAPGDQGTENSIKRGVSALTSSYSAHLSRILPKQQMGKKGQRLRKLELRS